MAKKIIRKWKSRNGKLMIGQSRDGKMFVRHIPTNTTLNSAGLLKKKKIIYNRFVHPETKEIFLVQRHS